MANLEIDNWYNISNSSTTINPHTKWQYCGVTNYGYLFQSFNIDYLIPVNEAENFVFTKINKEV